MARDKTKPLRGSDEQEEMTVVILRFKGGGESLQKGFDTVSQALAALGSPSLPERKTSPSLPGKQADTPHDGKNGNTSKTSRDEIEGEFEEVVEDNSEEVQQRSGGNRKYSKPKFDGALDLDVGDTTFKDYCEEKRPSTDTDKYLVAAAWLKKHGGHATFTASQIFTCFRAMNWPEQKDFMQPVRLMMKNKSYFEKKGRLDWAITTVGFKAAEAVTGK